MFGFKPTRFSKKKILLRSAANAVNAKYDNLIKIPLCDLWSGILCKMTAKLRSRTFIVVLSGRACYHTDRKKVLPIDGCPCRSYEITASLDAGRLFFSSNHISEGYQRDGKADQHHRIFHSHGLTPFRDHSLRGKTLQVEGNRLPFMVALG